MAWVHSEEGGMDWVVDGSVIPRLGGHKTDGGGGTEMDDKDVLSMRYPRDMSWLEGLAWRKGLRRRRWWSILVWIDAFGAVLVVRCS